MSKNLPKTQPLNKLSIDTCNIRQKHNPDTIKSLAESIISGGQLQALLVRQSKNGFGVIEGGRRLKAFNLLLEEGKIKATHPVEVMYFEGTDEEALNASMAANDQREDMGDADRILAFDAMHNKGKGLSVEDIAARNGMSPRKVRAYLKLASLPAPVLEKFKNEEMTLSWLELYASCQIPERLEEVLSNPDQWYAHHAVKQYLCPSKITGDSGLAKLVGKDAYIAAGGKIEEDLFSQRENTIWLNPEIAHGIVNQMLSVEAEKLKADGWENVTVWDVTGNKFEAYYYDEMTPFKVDESTSNKIVDHQKKISAISDKIYVDDSSVDTETYAKMEQEIAVLEQKIEELKKTVNTYSDEQKKTGICHLYIDWHDNLTLLIEDPNGSRSKKKAKKEQKPVRPDYSKKLTADLLLTKTFAGQLELANNSHVAKAYFVFSMLEAFTGIPDYGYSGIGISNSHEVHLAKPQKGEKSSSAALHALGQTLLETFNLKSTKDSLLNDLIGLKSSQLDTLLAFIIARQVNFNRESFDNKEATHSNAILDALNTDMTKHYTVSRDLLKGLSRGVIEAAVEEAGTGDELLTVQAAKTKGDMINVALPILQARNWLPPLLRTKNSDLKFHTEAKAVKPKKATKKAA